MLLAQAGSTNLAFDVVFGIFVIAFVGLSIFVAVWAIRRDAASRRQWQADADEHPEAPER